MPTLPIAACQIDRGVNGGVGRCSKENKLARTEPEQRARPVVPLRQRAMETGIEKRIDLAEAAKGSGDKIEGKRTVANVQCGPIRMALHHDVKSMPTAQHGIKGLQRHDAGRWPGSPWGRPCRTA